MTARGLFLFAVCLTMSAVAVGGTASCANSSPGGAGCAAVDVSFQNLGGDPPITVNNFSFENPSLAAGAYTQDPGTGCNSPCVPGSISGWVDTVQLGSFAGVFYPTTAYVGSGSSPSGTDVPDGVQVAYLSGNTSASLVQDVNTVVLANTLYTLSVDFGARVDSVPLPSSYGIELFNPNTSAVFAPSACAAPVAGAFVTCTISFDSSVLVSSVGQELGIVLFSNGPDAGEILFDNVQLGSQPETPEPGTIGLLGAGLALIVALRRQAARQSS